MSYFQAFTADGSLQFDAQSFAYRFVGKGSFTVETQYITIDDNTNPTITSGWVETAYDFDLAAFNSPDGPVYCAKGSTTFGAFNSDTGPTGGSWARIVGATGNIMPQGQKLNVNYWCFQRYLYANPSPHGAGMEIYDDQGHVVYSTLSNPLRVVQSIPSGPLYSGYSQSVGLSSSRTNAFVPFGSSQRFAGSVAQSYTVGVQSSPTSATFSEVPGYRSDYNLTSSTGGYLLADVTNY